MALSVSQSLAAFAGLVRWKNLLILGFCLLSFHKLLLRTASPYGLAPRLHGTGVALLAIALICITAAGYLINAIRDKDTDLINHPDRRWIPDPFAERTIRGWYHLALALGLVPAAWLAHRLNLYPWLILYPLVAWMLHRYSMVWKGRGLSGNVLVALLSGAVPMLLLIPEQDLLEALPSATRRQLWFLFGGFAGFAFLVSVFRELVKDLEDLAGDQAAGWRTYAVLAGPGRAIRLAIGLGTLSALVLIAGAVVYRGGPFVPGGLVLLTAIQAFLVLGLMKDPDRGDLGRISRRARWLLAAGLALIWLAP